MVDVLEKWAQHRTTNSADDNVAHWGSWAIYYLVTEKTRSCWLAADADIVLRDIAADTSVASSMAKSHARNALKELGL